MVKRRSQFVGLILVPQRELANMILPSSSSFGCAADGGGSHRPLVRLQANQLLITMTGYCSTNRSPLGSITYFIFYV
jgi:hypothetical protein